VKKPIRLTEAQLRSIINEVANETSMAQAKLQGPLNKFVQHMNGAKQALSELYQATTDQQTGEQVHALLNAVNKIISAVDRLPPQLPAKAQKP